MKFPYKTEPMEHQRSGLKHLVAKNGGALLWDCGTGKTKATIDFMAAKALQTSNAQLAIVICPRNALPTWPKELKIHCPVPFSTEVISADLSMHHRVQRMREIASEWPHEAREGEPWVHVVALNLDIFSHTRPMPGTKTVQTRQAMLKAIKEVSFDIAVIDEMHRIKRKSSNVTRALTSLAKHIPSRVGLTGTPQPHSHVDLYSQWLWIDPSEFVSYGHFVSRYVTMGGYMGKEIQYDKPRNEDELSERIAKKALVVKIDDVMELPEQTIIESPVEMDPQEKLKYDQMERSYMAEIKGKLIMAQNALVKWMKLRTIQSGFVKDEDGTSHDIGYSRATHVLDLTKDLVAQNEKVVIFTRYQRDIDSIKDLLTKSSKDSFRFIEGSTPDSERLSIREWFESNDSPCVVVCQIKTSAESINEFVVARHLIHMSLTEQRELFDQANARIKRKGQTRKTFVHVLTGGEGSIDHMLLQSFKDRATLEEQIMERSRL